MNNLHKELYSKAVDACISEANRQGLTHEEGLAWLWEKKYAELIVQECVNQMSDYLDKQRVMKHFGMEITDDK